MASWQQPTDQEEKLQVIFNELAKTFKKLKKANNPDKIHGMLKEITNGLKEGKALIKEFEFEARADGMPAPLLAERKRELVNQINGFIAMKKEVSAAQSAKNELITGGPQHREEDLAGMSMVQLVKKGHREIDEIDQGLNRVEKIALDTIDVGTNTAKELNAQTDKLNRIVDDLNEMEFDVKKATKVIGDITKGLLTDKCIGFLLFLVAGGVVAIIVVKIVKPNAKAITTAACNVTNCEAATNWTQQLINTGLNTVSNGVTNAANAASNAAGVGVPSPTATPAPGGRRMLIEKLLRAGIALANATLANMTKDGW